ncbi:MAG: VanZ family protein [Planctomycetota bacterium]|nr:VanZ family protein [Planctomycetota bacterium]
MKQSSYILRRRLTLVLFLIIWATAVIATHIPAERLPKANISDKILHAAGFFLLAGVFWLTLWMYGVDGAKRITLIFFTMLTYAAIDEMTQPLVGRENSLGDWLADVAGTIAALTLLELMALWRSWSAPRPAG